MPLNLRDQYQYFTEAKMRKLKDAGCEIKFKTLEESVLDYVENHIEKELYLTL